MPDEPIRSPAAGSSGAAGRSIPLFAEFGGERAGVGFPANYVGQFCRMFARASRQWAHTRPLLHSTKNFELGYRGGYSSVREVPAQSKVT